MAGGDADTAGRRAHGSTVGVVRVLWAVGGLLPERPVRHGPLDLGEASVGDAAGVARVLAPDRSRRSNKQLISRFRAQLLEACRRASSRVSVATSYRAPVGVTTGMYGRRQARSFSEWERRWWGLAVQRAIWWRSNGM